MDTVRWRQVESIVQQALDLAGEEREALVARECAGDEELLREVQSLLDSDEEAQKLDVVGAIQKAAKDYATERSGWIAEDLTGQKLGVYRVKRKIGEGGMSEVYLAVDSSGPVERKAAIKVLRGELRSAAMLARFEAERSILAHLNHPGIARLYDAGSTPRARPYVVMEFVEGVPVTRYCEQADMTVTGRVEVVAKIADALQYAHSNLVVHRDIKPENVLVTADGQPKILDFGIAKLLADPEGEVARERLTVTGVRLLTPQYASPEQLLGEPISVASDVYSLGVVLFELLTGQAPYAAPIPGKSTGDFVPGSLPSPSAVLRQSADKRLHREWRTVRGDLDNIVQAATRREPARRYGSMEQFAADLRRFLRAEPVSARPDTLSYRAAKFVRRNSGRVAAAVVATALLIGFTGMTIVQKRRAEARLSQVQQLATSVLEQVGALGSVPGALPHREKLAAAVKQHLDTLAPEASDSARFLADLSSAYIRLAEVQGLDAGANLGKHGDAVQSPETGCRLAQQALARTQSAASARLALRCELGLSRGLLGVGRAAEAPAVFARAEAVADRAREDLAQADRLGVDGMIEVQRSNILRAKGDRKGTVAALEAAVAAYAEADRLQKNAASRGSLRGARRFLADEYLAAGNAAAAAHLAEEIAEAARLDLPGLSLAAFFETASQTQWNAINVSAGEIGRAEQLSRQAVKLLEERLASDPANQAARSYLRASLASLSYALSHRGQFEEAAVRARQAGRICEEQVKSSPQSLSNWGALVRASLSLAVATYGTPESTAALARAREAMAKAWKLRGRSREGDDPSVSILMGRAASWRGAWKESETWFRQAVEDVKRGANAPESMMPHVRAQAYIGLARSLAARRECGEARQWRDKARAEYGAWAELPADMKASRFWREQTAAVQAAAAPCDN